MNRPIKFGAWNVPMGKMVQPDNLESINFDVKTVGVYMPIDNKGYHKLRLSDFILMQYTGLQDKKGKEIYEGDIVKYQGGTEWESIGEVKWGVGGFVIDWADGKRSGILDFWYPPTDEGITEVIGNIYESPHLLETST